MNGITHYLDEVARRLRCAHGKTVEAAMALGRELSAARAAVGHGSFQRLFRGHPNAIPNAVQFSLRAAEYYMMVAKKLRPYSQHVAILPNSLRVLLILCKLQPDALQSAIEQQRVHAGMTETEARGLLPQSPLPKADWSLDSVEEGLIAVINRAIEDAAESHPLLAELLRSLAKKLEGINRSEVHEAVSIAQDELTVRDAEPGGFLLFDDEHGASTHSGSPHVIGGCPSTYPDWYKALTTAQDSVTPLTRKQVEARLIDIDKGKLPTARTAQAHTAVWMAIKDLSRTSSLGKGVN